ncbi:MAG: helix-turn-helix domain-containing protein [Verrucomicrobiota bacterium]|nr:helix-turn-helix domain-containing protein [Verrucomicrobiota bacterium]
MEDTIGQRLAKRRLQRKISIADAARATKMRPERIADLEKDDYSNFPSAAYAKGFLLIYAKFLGVDVAGSDVGDSFGPTATSGSEDYEYLARAPRARPVQVRRPRKSLLRPMLVAAGSTIAGLVFLYFLLTFQRLGNPIDLAKKIDARENAGTDGNDSAPTPVVRRRRDATDTARAAAVESPGAEPVAIVALPSVSETPVPVQTPTPETIKTVSVRPLKKTWVKIQKGDANSAPVFEDWLYPDARPLTMRGTKFRIEARDRSAIEIQENGEVVPGDDRVTTIQ